MRNLESEELTFFYGQKNKKSSFSVYYQLKALCFQVQANTVVCVRYMKFHILQYKIKVTHLKFSILKDRYNMVSRSFNLMLFIIYKVITKRRMIKKQNKRNRGH